MMREILAEVIHDQIWSHWMRYQTTCCVRNPDGSLTIPPDKVERWNRQANTLYSELPEEERESDRHQADKILECLVQYAIAESKKD